MRLTLDHWLGEAHRLGLEALRGAERDGLHTLPDGFADAYDALMALPDQTPPAVDYQAGSWERQKAEAERDDWYTARDAQAAELWRRANNALQPFGRTIEQHIGPALDARLEQFRADVATLGPHAGKVAPDDAVVAEATAFRPFGEAWARYAATPAWYLRLRQSWAVLRERDEAGGVPDPLGTDSILAEVANAAQIRPDDWRNLRISWGNPWGHAAHARLVAILRDGGRVWMPSAAQQWAAYAPHVPDAVNARLGIDPRDAIWQMADRQPRS